MANKKTGKTKTKNRKQQTCECENLKRLSRSSILMNFVKKCNGSWDHDAWLKLCGQLEDKGYAPIDFDHVGLLLEEKKASYLERQP